MSRNKNGLQLSFTSMVKISQQLVLKQISQKKSMVPLMSLMFRVSNLIKFARNQIANHTLVIKSHECIGNESINIKITPG